MKLLFCDTETTGFLAKAEPQSSLHARCVQLGGIMTDEHGTTQLELNAIIRPDGFLIPPVVVAIHGISQERATDFGLSGNHVMGLFAGMVGMADLVVFHNADYDRVILISEFYRRTEQPILDHKKLYCTMKGMTPICGLLKANNTPKWPKLQEAHKFCFGVEFDGAHDAMADVRACKDVFFWMVKNNYIQLDNLISG